MNNMNSRGQIWAQNMNNMNSRGQIWANMVSQI